MAQNGDELANLHKQADELRRDILGLPAISEAEKELVQRVGNEKGQEWGWSHSWGWPTPFDDKEGLSRGRQETNRSQGMTDKDLLLQLQSEFKDMLGADGEDLAAFLKFFFDGNMHIDPKEVEKRIAEEERRSECRRPRTWGWSRSWQWPPPADSMRHDDAAYSPRALENDPEMKKAGVQWREAYDELMRADQNGGADDQKYKNWRRGCGRHRHWGRREHDAAKSAPQQQIVEVADEPSYEYSHDHEDQHDDPPTPKIAQGKSAQGFQAPKEDDHVARQEQELQRALERQRQAKQQFWGMLGGQGSHEQDQTKEPQEQDNSTSTELDVYEQLLNSKEQISQPPASLQPENGVKPSILSTMTTTERTIAPDGSVTTKVVLKKRFTDGREESTETVHTARGQEDSPRYQDPWKAIRDAEERPVESIQSQVQRKQAEKKGGWFWSS